MTKSTLDPVVLEMAEKKRLLNEAFSTDPVIEELDYNEFKEDIENGVNKPKKIVLKRRYVLKECGDCGNVRQMFPNQTYCRKSNCRSESLRIIDVDELYEQQLNEYNENIESMTKILDWKKEDKDENIDIIRDIDD